MYWGLSVRILMTRWFGRFARKERLGAAALLEAVQRAERGLVDADLGGGIIKQQVGRPGKGRSGGYRTVVLYRSGARAIFAFGFAKSRKANLEPDELEVYRELAKVYLALSEQAIDRHVNEGSLTEVE